MYRVLTTLVLILAMTAAEIRLMDGFFGKPANKLLDVFRNPELFPYRYHNAGRDQQSSQHERTASDGLNEGGPDSMKSKGFSSDDKDYCRLDSPDSLTSKWFSSDDKDFCRMTKAIIIVFAIFGFASLLVLAVFISRRYFFADYEHDLWKTDSQSSSGCMCGQSIV